jgi:hypothetical protein
MLLQNRNKSEMQLSTLSNKMAFQFRSKNNKAAQVGYNSERSLRDHTKHIRVPSKNSLLGARCSRESKYEPNLWTKGSGC